MKSAADKTATLPERLIPLLLLIACAGAALLSVKPEIVQYFVARTGIWLITLLPGLALGVACAGWGALLVLPMRGLLTMAEWLAVALGCGLGVMALGAGALGLSATLTSTTAAVLVAVGLALFGAQCLCQCRHGAGALLAARSLPCRDGDTPRGIVLLLGGLLAGTVMMLTAVALSPPLLFDVTEYHLGGWTDFRTALGAVHFTAAPHNFYLRFPFPVESLYYLGLALTPYTDASPKILNTLTVLACAALAACAVRRMGFGRAAGMLAALVVFGHPVMLEVSLDAMIDAPVALLVAASVYTALIVCGLLPGRGAAGTAQMAGCGGAGTPWAAITPAFLFGAALASKYTVAQIYLLPWLVVIAPLLWHRSPRHWPALLAAALLAGLPCLLWLGKNLALYGNPLEPFFVKWFRPADTGAIAREKFYIDSHFPQSPITRQYWQMLLPRLREFGWIILALAAGWRFRPRAAWLLRVLVFAAGAWLLWNTVRDSQNRFLLPAMVLLSAVAVGGAFSFPARWQRRAAGGLLMFYAGLHLGHHALRVHTADVADYLLNYQPGEAELQTQSEAGTVTDTAAGSETKRTAREEFYETNLADLGRILSQMRDTLPPDARVLLIYEARPYLFAHEVDYNVVWDESLLMEHLRGATTVEEAWQRLRQAGYTHVLVNRQELLRYIQQYARPSQLRRLGLAPDKDPRAVWGLTPYPDDLFPPHYLDKDWRTLRPLVRAFLEDVDRRATLREGTPSTTPGVKPMDITVTPVP